MLKFLNYVMYLYMRNKSIASYGSGGAGQGWLFGGNSQLCQDMQGYHATVSALVLIQKYNTGVQRYRLCLKHMNATEHSNTYIYLVTVRQCGVT